MSIAKDMNKVDSGAWLNPDRVIVDQMLGCDQRLMLATHFLNHGSGHQHAMLLRDREVFIARFGIVKDNRRVCNCASHS